MAGGRRARPGRGGGLRAGRRHTFTSFDDDVYILLNPEVTGGLSWEGFVWAFGYHAANWHPLTWLSHMLDAQLFGLWAGGHHLMNASFHAANAVLLLLDEWPLGRTRAHGGHGAAATWQGLVNEKVPLFLMSLVSSLSTYRGQSVGVIETIVADLPTRLADSVISCVGLPRLVRVAGGSRAGLPLSPRRHSPGAETAGCRMGADQAIRSIPE